MAHHHLALQLLDRLQRDADHNDDRSAAHGHIAHVSQVAVNNRDQRDHRKEEGADQSQLGKDLRDKISGRLAGADTGNGAAVLFQVI